MIMDVLNLRVYCTIKPRYGKILIKGVRTNGDGFYSPEGSVVSLTPYCGHCASELDGRKVLLLNEMPDGGFFCLWNWDKRYKRMEGNADEVSIDLSRVEK